MIAIIVKSVEVGKKLARRAGLIYVNDYEKGFLRRRVGKGFVYLSLRGKRVTSLSVLKRITTLAIPPAWEEVWICSTSNGHIQARGRDADGRLQSIYHAKWHEVSAATKYDRMQAFARYLPLIRKAVDDDLKGVQLTKRRVQAAVVSILDKAHIRVGNERYAKERDSRGATTLTKKHVNVRGSSIALDFPGKSGQWQSVTFSDRKVAKVIRQCEEIRGQFLFRYLDENLKPQTITSGDVNDYLRDVTSENFTAKDFRTWWGTVAALEELLLSYDASTKTSRRKSIVRAVGAASNELGNTKAVCRKSYVHPGLLAHAEAGTLANLFAKLATHPSRGSRRMSAVERSLTKLLRDLRF